jgi:hypothetical protein
MSIRLNTVSRLAASIGAAALMFVVVGCGAPEEGDGTFGTESFQCASIRTWAPKEAYTLGEQVQFEGGVFKCVQAHTAFDPGWTPKVVASLWKSLGTCADAGTGQQPPVTQPPVTQPPVTQPPVTQPPVVQPPTGGNGGQCVGGPKFDPSGAKNVGNGKGQQFIGGQCLSTADCASGCCAFPCGICSGPGAQFQAGKQGCGFPNGK